MMERMRGIVLVAGAALVLAVFVSLAHAAYQDLGGPGGATAEASRAAMQALDLSPALFVENKGQWDESVRYGFDGKGVRVSFTDAGPVFQMLRTTGDRENHQTEQAVFSATFAGARRVRPTALEPSSTKMSYYIGNDRARWRPDVPSYQKMLYKGLYEGVDLYTWGKRSGLKYEFHLAPGADWWQIVVRYDGIEGLSIDEKGALHVRTALGEMVDEAPVVYQEAAGRRTEVASRFRLVGERSYGFEIMGAIDSSLPLVLDPTLAWGSFLGGCIDDYGYGIACDSAGNVWVAGHTSSPDFPVVDGFSTFRHGGGDAFVARISPSGTLDWASYLGGCQDDPAFGIACDSAGNAWVTGSTISPDFPVTAGAFGPDYNGGRDAFVARISPGGSLDWASYLVLGHGWHDVFEGFFCR